MAFNPPELIGETQAFSLCGDWITRRRQYFALYDRTGMPYRHSGFSSGRFRNAAEANPDLGRIRKKLGGPVLFAGQVSDQFGHVLLNSIGRLWALERLPDDTTLYYITKYQLPRKKQLHRKHRHLQPVLDLFGIRNKVLITRHSLQIDQAYLASDLFGEVHEGCGAPQFYAWIDRRLPPPGPVEPGRAVYVTRCRLGPGNGRFACEDHLERLLQDRGYTIFAPEQHDLKTQVETFQRAERLIFAEGSALHLYALVARPCQNVAVIHRRMELPPLMINQLRDRPGHRVTVVNAVTDVYWPPKAGDHYSVSVIDFEQVKHALLKARLIDNARGWTEPSPADLQASLSAGLSPGEALLDEAARAEFKRDRRAATAERRA
ncbi:MAG: glycosyltransferase 61 family protein [Rhodobacter sp.]|nr:glycosyltransferase 61 family protein [Rhodobacter sp.]